MSWGASSCPCVEKVQGSSLLPVRVERKITLQARNLHLYEVQHTHSQHQHAAHLASDVCQTLICCVFRTRSWTTSACWSSRARRWWWTPTWKPMTWIHQTLTSPVSYTRCVHVHDVCGTNRRCVHVFFTRSRWCFAVHVFSSGGGVQRHGVREEERHVPRGQPR